MASGYSLDLVTSYDQNKDKHTFYTGTDCTKKLCDDLKDHAMDIINAEKRVIISLTDYEKRVYEKQNYCHICKRKFCYDKDNESKCEVFRKVRDHCHHNTGKFRGAAHNICNRRYKEKREIPVVLHNGSNYDYHLIIKELAEKFKGNIDCLGENTEKYITFSVPLKKEFKNKKLVTYKQRFIDSSRFMSTSLASLVDNLSKVGTINCKKCLERYSTKSECRYIKQK